VKALYVCTAVVLDAVYVVHLLAFVFENDNSISTFHAANTSLNPHISQSFSPRSL